MEIDRTTQEKGRPLIKVSGRLDAASSKQLEAALDANVQEGDHHLNLDLTGIDYLSSAGIRVLMKTHRQLRAIQGACTISAASETVCKVLEMAGMQSLLARPDTPVEPTGTTATPLETASARIELHALNSAARLNGEICGRNPFATGTAKTSERLRFPACTYGLGIGAFGQNFEEAKTRFGEFAAIHGAVAALPADGRGTPDDLVSTGKLVPEIEALHAITMRGEFSHFFRFDHKPDVLVPLTELLERLTEWAGHSTAAFVMVAESAGLVGASLRRSPAITGAGSAFEFPEIRDWLSFTSEPVHDKELALLIGCVERPAGTREFLPQWYSESDLGVHVHAVTFPYRPLPRGLLALEPTVHELFETGGLTGLLHLLHDDRLMDGIGESRFRRGGCWLAPMEINEGEMRS